MDSPNFGPDWFWKALVILAIMGFFGAMALAIYLIVK